MTDASFFISASTARNVTADISLPAPVPFATPVLIGDCASPLAGETILSLIWRRLDHQCKRPNQWPGRKKLSDMPKG